MPTEQRHNNELLSQKYSVTGFPTILFLRADGSVIGKTGYVALG